MSIRVGVASSASRTPALSGTNRSGTVFVPCSIRPSVYRLQTRMSRASRSMSPRSSAIHSSGRRPVPTAKTGMARYRSPSSSAIASTLPRVSNGMIGLRSWRFRFGFLMRCEGSRSVSPRSFAQVTPAGTTGRRCRRLRRRARRASLRSPAGSASRDDGHRTSRGLAHDQAVVVGLLLSLRGLRGRLRLAHGGDDSVSERAALTLASDSDMLQLGESVPADSEVETSSRRIDRAPTETGAPTLIRSSAAGSSVSTVMSATHHPS